MPAFAQPQKDKFLEPINVQAPHISTDKSEPLTISISSTFARRARAIRPVALWTEIAHPAIMDASGDLMLLHPDGSEEVLVRGGDDGSVTDPFVSFDGEWVFYSHLKGLKGTSLILSNSLTFLDFP